MANEVYKISSAEEFAILELDLLLPSGRKIRVKDADVVNIVLGGATDVPEFISSMVLGKLNGIVQPKLEITKENLPDIFGFMNLIITACVTNYKVVKSGADRSKGEVNIEDFRSDEKLCIFNVCMPLNGGQAKSSFQERVEQANKESEKLLKPSKKTTK